ncbi:MAG: alpha/beta fold hydrolase [Caldilineaceae bacterium]|nr:alpha/beta fold hydrolase [Caldilineaceae bacterium]
MKRTIFLVLTLILFIAPIAPRPARAQAACGQDVIVRAGDTMSTLAERYLGSAVAYDQIISATNAAAAVDDSYAVIDNANFVNVGWKLCIPGDGESAAIAIGGGGDASPATAEVNPVAEELPFDGEALTVEYLRNQRYPGSEIVIEETLAPGSNYSRYLVSYRSEGLKIYALLTIPDGDAPASGWPAIIFNHGYIPPAVYRTTERYVAYVDGFASQGYVVFRPDYRGHGFSEGDARGAYGYPDYTVDVLNALASVKRLPEVDPGRIGMWGHSMGGYITLRAMVTSKEIKAGVIWAGVVASYPDLISRWNRRASVPTDIPRNVRRWRTQLIDEYGAPEENPTFWASISANSYLEDLAGPVQIHHGTADSTVPLEFSTTLLDQIANANGEAELYTYAGDDHNISQGFSEAMARSVQFFDTYVKNTAKDEP